MKSNGKSRLRIMKEGNNKTSEKVKITAKNLDIKRDDSAFQTQKTEFPHSTNLVADQILFLQRTIGNQAVQRLLKSGVIQTKLRIDQHVGKYGQETDCGADSIMWMLNPQFQRESEQPSGYGHRRQRFRRFRPPP